MFDLFNEFRSLVAALDRNQIEYALCGALAMAIHGRARATVDIDLLLPSDSLNAAKDIAHELGYNIRGLDMSFAKGAVEIRFWKGSLKMEQGDMSAAAVTARLRLVSELTKLCLSLKTAKIKQREADEGKNVIGETSAPRKNEP